jgi:transposase
MFTHSNNGTSKEASPRNTSETEVRPAKAKRRSFTAAQKLKILRETEALEHGELGAYLRRQGIFSSSLSTWRQQRDEGLLTPKGSPKRGRPGKSADTKELERLKRENEKLKKQLDQADMIISAQKKLCEIYGQNPERKGESK